MPEGVETEITRGQLESLIAGKKLNALSTWDPMLKGLERCRGVVSSVQRHGKVIWFNFKDDGGSTSLTTRGFTLRLSMSGALVTQEAFKKFKKAKERVVFEFEPPAPRLILVDPRRFAKIQASDTFKKKGWDILTNLNQENIPAELDRILRETRGNLKALLMNQGKIAGLGNAYANEILFAAGISPKRKASALKSAQRENLWRGAKSILSLALKKGGISMRNYFHPNGGKGAFQNEFAIYGKSEGEPCVRCKGFIKVYSQSQRSTFYCPKCQR